MSRVQRACMFVLLIAFDLSRRLVTNATSPRTLARTSALITGGCNSSPMCDPHTGTGDPPSTLPLSTADGNVHYDISLIDGYYLPARIDNDVGCHVAGCEVDLGPNCMSIPSILLPPPSAPTSFISTLTPSSTPSFLLSFDHQLKRSPHTLLGTANLKGLLDIIWPPAGPKSDCLVNPQPG